MCLASEREGRESSLRRMTFKRAIRWRAVKVLFCDTIERRGEGSEALSRFAAEYAILRKLDHPNIVHVCEAGQVPSAYYFIAMSMCQERR